MTHSIDRFLAFTSGQGIMSGHMRTHDWDSTSLGSPQTWSAPLRTSVDLLLGSGFASSLVWGEALTFMYNDPYAVILGDRHPQALGRSLKDVWPEAWPTLEPLLQQAFQGETIRLDDMPLTLYRHGHAEETFFTFFYSPVHEHDGSVGGVYCGCIERTQEVLAERERAAAEVRLREFNVELEQQVAQRTQELRLYRDIVESDVAPVVAFDTAYRVIEFNAAHGEQFLRVMGREQQVGDVLPDLFPPDQALTLRSLMDRALGGEAFSVIEEFGDSKFAKPTWEVSYTPLRNAQGQVIGAFHQARDVSARVAAQHDVQVLQDQLRQSQKIEAIGQLTGGVAHDFNNFLTIIKSSTELLKRAAAVGLSDEKRARYVDAIATTVDRAAKLTGQLLAFARRQTLKPEVFAACDSVRALSDMMGTLTGSQIRIVMQLPVNQCFVDVDPSQFDTALVNMAFNARDAMEGTGLLTVRVEPVDLIPGTAAQPSVAGSFVAVSLADTGPGVPADLIERIFEPFFTTKGVGKGTGLGLSQVFGFAKQSGGDVRVFSTPGGGATFTLYLPRVEGKTLDKPDEPSESMIDGHGLCVLVVEDNTDVGTFAIQTLEDLGYRTVLATHGQEALDKLAEDSDRFDVVFSDVIMPGMSGIDLAHEIRRTYHDLPVLLVSGYSHVLAQNGTYGFELLHKPYSIEELSRLLRKVATWQRRKGILGR